MRKTAVVAVAGLLALAACGNDDSGPSSGSPPANGMVAERGGTATEGDGRGVPEGVASGSRKGTTVTLGRSRFGPMLFGARRQAIYIFQRDRKGKSVCYGKCADAWPPVFTRGRPKAGTGVKGSLLGTTRRRDGKLQVTYAGKPLYFYAHEGPGQVRCHNVDLNGGLWWVVGRDGKRRA